MVTINNGINNTVGASNTGVTNTFTITNPSNTASSQASELITVGGGTAGDAFTQWQIAGTTNYVAGIDNSDSDKWKLSVGTALGTNDTVTVFGTTGGQYRGYNTGVLVNAGCLGEFMQFTRQKALASSLTNATPTNIVDVNTGLATLTLTPGVWCCTMAVGFIGTGITGTALTAGMSTTSATLPTDPAFNSVSTSVMPTVNSDSFIAFSPIIKRISVNTTYYFVVQADFTVGAITVYCNNMCWRIS